MARALFAKRRSVGEEWDSWLPPEKRAFFNSIQERWERSFFMSGIALQEAIKLRDQARFDQACLHVQMTSQIVARNSAELLHAINIMQVEARHLGDLPEVGALNSLNFRTEAAKRTAQWNTLFHWVLFDARSRFFQKLRLLDSMIQEATAGFAAMEEELLESPIFGLQAAWEDLADFECDLNTCAREVEIVFKAFLGNLPAPLTPAVRRQFEARLPGSPRRSHSRTARVSR